MEKSPCRLARTHGGPAIHAMHIPAVFSPRGFTDPEQKGAGAGVGGIGADRRGLDLYSCGGRKVQCLEVFPMDVSGPCLSGREPAKLAQIHRTCRVDWWHGEKRYPQHRFRGLGWPVAGV